MLENNFTGELLKYCTKKDTIFNVTLLLLKSSFEKFSKENIFSIEGTMGAVTIAIRNKQEILFIDLNNNDINIRYNFTEFYIFIDELNFEEFNNLLENFFKGNYRFECYYNENIVVKQELIFIEDNLKKFNTIDRYSNEDYHNVITKNGYNWFL